jgi:hypothetical protein
MELAIPLIAMGGLYIATNQKSGFATMSKLPNVDVPDSNYPNQPPNVYSAESEPTSRLSTVNQYDGRQAYTDKYFKPPAETTNTTKYTSVTGEQVDENYFRHNNMVPFFGGNIRTRSVDAKASESVLDNYIGTGSLIMSKQERAPLFSPSENQQWANGAPNSTDFMRSRVNPSMRMANVKPFEEERVAPGLGLGFTSDGGGGFNSGMMNRDAWSEKTVDELRVATNPKSSGHMILDYAGPANSLIKRTAFEHSQQQGVQEKNRVDGSFAMNSDRYMTTTGIEKGPMLRSVPVEKDVSRPETSASYAGVAAYGNSTVYVDGEHMPTHRIELGAVPFTAAGASGKGAPTESDYGIKAKMAYPNNRSSNFQDKYFGAVGGAFGAAVAPLLDALRPSRKENTIGNLRPYQNAKSSVAATYLFDPTQLAPKTIREMTENSKFHMNINANQRGGGYATSDHQMAQTARATTGDFYYAGGSSASGAKEMRRFDGEHNQRNNDVKSSTINGRMGNGNTNVFSGIVNMEAKQKDLYLVNNRQLMQKGAAQSPSAENIGRVSGGVPLYQTIQMDRTTPDFMSALQGNPYAIPYSAK